MVSGVVVVFGGQGHGFPLEDDPPGQGLDVDPDGRHLPGDGFAGLTGRVPGPPHPGPGRGFGGPSRAAVHQVPACPEPDPPGLVHLVGGFPG